MTDKAYIVANKQQEMSVLEKLESEGYRWFGGEKPTEWVPSKHFITDDNFPIAIINDLSKHITFDSDYDEFDNDATVVYDGRKEEQMSEKYVVSQEFMNELEDWKQSNFNDDFMFVNGDTIDDLSDEIDSWWYQPSCDYERNNRLIAIIRWLNGEDVFEVEKPKKWVVRDKVKDVEGDYWYVLVEKDYGVEYTSRHTSYSNNYTKFDTKEEAQSWANSHQEVIEVEG